MAERRESVRLELQDAGFSTGMARAAAATGLLERALKSLDGTTVNVHERISSSGGAFDGMSKSAARADNSINQLTGRLRLFAEAAAILGPTAGPLGGAGIAGIAGLANQMGAAVVAGGVLIGSLQGVGDALGAMNKAQLDPTNKNLEAAEDALKRLTPAARDFAEAAFDLKPALVAIRNMGQEALMPGLTESLDNLERLGPKVGGIFTSLADAMGEIAADSSASLASARWADFFAFVEREVPDAVTELATTVGDLTHGMTELWEAFTPLNDGFSSWMMDAADGFDQWATGLSATEGFAEFVDYIQTTGPQLADTLGALANAMVQIVQASAPLGGPVLAGLEAVANAIATIADSDLGTPILAGVAALSLLNRTLAVTASLSKVSMSAGLFGGLGTASKGIKGQAGSIKADIAAMSDTMVAFGANTEKAGAAADRMKQRLATGAGLAGFAVAATGAADAIGLTNTTSLALMGTLGGPPGVALGAAAGALMDMRAAGQGATEAIDGLNAAVQSGDMNVLSEQIAAAKTELADITDLDFGGDIFDRIGFQIADTFGGPSMDDAREKIKASERALYDMAEAEKLAEVRAKGAELAFLQQTGANIDLAKWSGKSKEQIKAQADAIIESKEAADETARSFVGLGDSVNDSKTSLNGWIKEMASTADALNNFTTNSIKAAKRGLNDGLIRSLQAAGKEGALRMRQLANGTEEQIGRANAAFRKGENAIERYNNYKVPPKKVTADNSQAMGSFREVDQYLSSLDGRTATTYVNTVRTITGPQGAAVFGQQENGSVLDFYADGGVENHVAQIAPAGSWRVWAEPETGGEAYIPLAPAKRERSIDIWEQVGSRLGVAFERFADGGTTGGDGKTDKEREEDRKARAEERKERAEALRLKKLDNQRLRELLQSDLRNDREQAALEVADARRRLLSAKKAGRPGSEILDAKLALKTERADLQDIRREARVTAAIDRLTPVVENQTAAVEQSTEAAEKAADETARWAEKMDQVAKATVSGFNTGLFDKGSNPWAAGSGGGALFNLNKDIAGLQERGALQSQLSGMGITGDALAAMLSEGTNADLSALIASGQAGSVAAAFDTRAALQGSVGAAGAQAAYGARHAAAQQAEAAALAEAQRQTAILTGLQTKIERLENPTQRTAKAVEHFALTAPERMGEEVGRAVNGAAAAGQRDRNRNGRG